LGLLTGFYLYFPSVSSRYLIDFAPGIAVSIWLFLLVLKDKLTLQHRANQRSVGIVLIGVFAWWGAEVFMASVKPSHSSENPLTYDQLLLVLARGQEYQISAERFPDEYRLTLVGEHHYGLPYNGDGWDSVTGNTKAAMTLFVRDPEFLDLVVAPAEGVKLSDSDYTIIQAKIGLENLKLETVQDGTQGRILHFAGPKLPINRVGLQVAFIGFVTANELHIGDSKFRLLGVRWRYDSHQAGHNSPLEHPR
jgi:hypothetical protein